MASSCIGIYFASEKAISGRIPRVLDDTRADVIEGYKDPADRPEDGHFFKIDRATRIVDIALLYRTVFNKSSLFLTSYHTTIVESVTSTNRTTTNRFVG